MKNILRRLFKLNAGEGHAALLFSSLGFLWSFGINLGNWLGDALLLSHKGSAILPTVFGAEALLMLPIALLLIRCFHRYAAHRIFLCLIGSNLLFYFSLFIFLKSGGEKSSSFFCFGLRMYSAMSLALAITCYWNFIDQYHSFQAAKRFYCLFSSTIFLGMAATGTVMRTPFFDTEATLLMIVSALGLAFFWILYIARTLSVACDEEIREEESDQTSSIRSLISSIIQSPFTLLLIAGNFLTFLLSVLTEVHYLSYFGQMFQREVKEAVSEAPLSLFLGNWITVVSVLNLFFGLFLYSRILQKFGFATLLLITPLSFLTIYLGGGISSSVLFPLLGFFVVEGSLYVIDDNNCTLLLNAVPKKIKYKLRVAVEALFEPCGTIVACLLLQFSPFSCKLLGLFFSSLLLIVVLAQRTHYFRTIYNTLIKKSLGFNHSLFDWWKQVGSKEQDKAKKELFTLLAEKDFVSQHFAIESLLRIADASLFKQLLGRIDLLSSQVKMEFIRLVIDSSFAKDSALIPFLQKWSQQKLDPSLHDALLLYLAEFDLLIPEKLSHHLSSHDLSLVGAAILSFKQPWLNLPSVARTHYKKLATDKQKELLHSEEEESICLALQTLGKETTSELFARLLLFLKHTSPKIAHTAARSLERVCSEQSDTKSQELISLLYQVQDPIVRQQSIKALSKTASSHWIESMVRVAAGLRPNERQLMQDNTVQMGQSATPSLRALVHNRSLARTCRLFSAKALALINPSVYRSRLRSLLLPELEEAYCFTYHMQSIPEQFPFIDTQLLLDLLRANVHSLIDFVVQMLSIANSGEAELLSQLLKKGNRKTKEQILETVEKLREPKITRLLHPFLTNSPEEEKVRLYQKVWNKAASLEQLLETLSHSSSQLDQNVAAIMKVRFKLPNWEKDLKEQIGRGGKLFQGYMGEQVNLEIA